MFNKFVAAIALTLAAGTAVAQGPLVIKINPKICAGAYEYAYEVAKAYNENPNRDQKVFLAYIMGEITNTSKNQEAAGDNFGASATREELRGVGFLRDQVSVLKVYMDNGVGTEKAQREVARNMFNLCLNTNSYIYEPIKQPQAPAKAKVKGASI